MNKHRPTFPLAACVLAAGAFFLPKASAAAGDGTTGSNAIRYLAQTKTWTQDHRYDDWGKHTSLNVGTGAGKGHLSVQNGARVEVAGALFIAGKGYHSPWRIEDGNDGLVTVGRGSTLECGSQTSSSGTAQVYVGWGSGVKGTLRVDGGHFISNYILRVGCHEDSQGVMEVTNGGRVTLRLGEAIADKDASHLSIATAAGSRGVLRVSGGSALAFDVKEGERSRADVGTGGNGTLIVEGGSRVSLGQDYASVGDEGGSQGLVQVRGGSVLELPRITYLALASGSQGDVVVEGKGSSMSAQNLYVGPGGAATLSLRKGATASVSGLMSVGAGQGSGRVSVASGAQLTTSGQTVVGARGRVQLSGRSRWLAQGNAVFRRGSTLAFAVSSLRRVPEIVVSPGASLTLAERSRVQLTLSRSLLRTAARGKLELPLIQGRVVGSRYDYELVNGGGLFDTTSLVRLPDGRWGLRVTLDREALRRNLTHDAARLANGLWSSTGGLQDYSTALLNRAGYRPGSHVWGMGLGSFSSMSSQGGSPGYDFNGGGYAAGADTSLGDKRLNVGMSFGQLCGSNQSDDGLTRIRQNSLMGSLYARYDSHPGEPGRRTMLDAYASGGRVRNHARSSFSHAEAQRSSGHWWDDVYALGLRAMWELPVAEDVSLLPFIGLRYLHGSHGSFTLHGGDYARACSSANLHILSLPVGFTLRGRCRIGRAQELLPEMTLAYVGDLSRKNPRLGTSLLGEEVRSGGSAPGRQALMLSVGTGWLISERWSAGLYYQLECRRHEVGQAVNMSVGCTF